MASARDLAKALEEEEAHLHRLEVQRVEAKARVAALRAEISTREVEPASPREVASVPPSTGPRSPADKIALFRRLFRGREDVYPTRFISKKTGKPGYAPACANKFVAGLCELPKVKCSDCTLILVHRRPLLDQWLAQLALFLGLDRKEIGQIGGTRRTPTGSVDVAMIQSLVRRDSVDDLVAGSGQVIVDECHHVPAVQFERVMREVKARYVVGLTATPQRRDGHHPIIQMQLGPVRFKVDAKAQASARPFEHRLVVRETAFRTSYPGEKQSIQDLYAALARDDARNTMILNDVVQALEEGRSPILLTERKDHLEHLASRIERVARHLIVLQGGMGAKVDRAVRAHLDAIPPYAERLLLATGRYIGEGFDDARLDTLFLALPVSWKGTLVQYTGRLHRLHPGKREVRIFDYVDREIPMLLPMFEKRLRGYRAIGYARGEAPLGYAEPRGERLVEYDDDVLRVRDHEFATDWGEDVDAEP
jgi:superfamily II DNA or RNA helicase